MAKLDRVFHKIFGLSGSSTKFGQFGSARANPGSPTTSKDLTILAQLAAWVNGWQDALVTTANGDAPAMEEINGVQFYHSRQMGYLFEAGVPEWDSGTTYYIGCVVRKVGTMELYGSFTDANVGNALPVQVNSAFWKYLNPPAWLPGDMKFGQYYDGSIEYGFLAADFKTVGKAGSGADYEGAAYKALYDRIRNANGGTYDWDALGLINLPDFRGRSPIGAGTGSGGLTPRVMGARFGVEKVGLIAAENGPHNHGIIDPGHVHLAPGGQAFIVSNLGSRLGGNQYPAFAAANSVMPATTGITTATVGSGTPHENMQPSLVVNAIIRYL